jgi:hypothetical protein
VAHRSSPRSFGEQAARSEAYQYHDREQDERFGDGVVTDVGDEGRELTEEGGTRNRTEKALHPAEHHDHEGFDDVGRPISGATLFSGATRAPAKPARAAPNANTDA